MNNVFSQVRGSTLVLPVPPTMEISEAIHALGEIQASIIDAYHKWARIFRTLRQEPGLVGEPRFALVRNVRELERSMEKLFEEKRLVLSQMPSTSILM